MVPLTTCQQTRSAPPAKRSQQPSSPPTPPPPDSEAPGLPHRPPGGPPTPLPAYGILSGDGGERSTGTAPSSNLDSCPQLPAPKLVVTVTYLPCSHASPSSLTASLGTLLRGAADARQAAHVRKLPPSTHERSQYHAV